MYTVFTVSSYITCMQCSAAVFGDAVSVGWQLVGGAAVDPEGEQDPAILLTEPWGGAQ